MMKPSFDNFEDIKQFFSGYFNQDWAEDSKSPEEVVSNYLKENKARDIQIVATQIQQFLNLYNDDKELENALFLQLGCYYSPSAVNISPRTWLQNIIINLTTKNK